MTVGDESGARDEGEEGDGRGERAEGSTQASRFGIDQGSSARMKPQDIVAGCVRKKFCAGREPI
jgi:hypothetical protein